jgi:hypothetical protein
LPKRTTRTNPIRRVVGAALAEAVCAACGPLPPSPEEQALAGFFRASRLRDTTALARIAAVVFEPRSDGVVQDFEVSGSDQEQPQEDGTGLAKHVTIRARVRTPGGEIVPRTIVVTMERAGDAAQPYRWFITGFTPPPVSQTSPGAFSGPPS